MIGTATDDEVTDSLVTRGGLRLGEYPDGNPIGARHDPGIGLQRAREKGQEGRFSVPVATHDADDISRQESQGHL